MALKMHLVLITGASQVTLYCEIVMIHCNENHLKNTHDSLCEKLSS
jgi:hypothetical protein